MRYFLSAVCLLSICSFSIQTVLASKQSEEKKKNGNITPENNHRLMTLETIPKWVQQGQFRVKKFLGKSAHLVEDNGETDGKFSSQKETAAKALKEKRAAIEKIRQLLREDLARLKNRSAEPHTAGRHDNHRKSSNHQRSKEKRGGKTKTTTPLMTSTTTKRPKKKDSSHRISTTTPDPNTIPPVRGLGDGFGRHT